MIYSQKEYTPFLLFVIKINFDIFEVFISFIYYIDIFYLFYWEE